MTHHISLKQLRPSLPEVVQRVDKGLDRYVVTRRGRPVSVIISPDDYEGLIETLDILEDKAGLKRLIRAKREAKAGKTRSLDEVKLSLGLV